MISPSGLLISVFWIWLAGLLSFGWISVFSYAGRSFKEFKLKLDNLGACDSRLEEFILSKGELERSDYWSNAKGLPKKTECRYAPIAPGLFIGELVTRMSGESMLGLRLLEILEMLILGEALLLLLFEFFKSIWTTFFRSNLEEDTTGLKLRPR